MKTMKRYRNRKLYDPETSSYLVHADLKKLIESGIEFEIRDESGADITRNIVWRIFCDMEGVNPPHVSIIKDMITSGSIMNYIRDVKSWRR